MENFHLKNFDIFLIFGAKIRKIGIPLHTPVLLYKSGVQVGGYTLHGHVFLMNSSNRVCGHLQFLMQYAVIIL